MEKYNELKTLVESLKEDVDKFYGKGVAAAGTRVRKSMQAIKVLAQDIRNEVSAKKNEVKG